MNRFGVLLLVGLVTANDLVIGPNGVGNKIYDEKKEASPAIWRQVNNVTIQANNGEVINSINISDLRPEKDGEANIVEGGIGHQNVTIQLKSPTVFRGYAFQIQAFAVPVSEFKGVIHDDTVISASTEQTETNHPILIAKDETTTRPVRSNEPSTTEVNEETISTDKSEYITPKSIENTKEQDISTVVMENITPKIKENSNEVLRNVRKIFTSDSASTETVEMTSVLPTTEDEAQIINVGGKNTTTVNHYPPITHEEQGKKDSDVHTSEPSLVLHEQSSPKPKVNDLTTVQEQYKPMEETLSVSIAPASIEDETTEADVSESTKSNDALYHNYQGSMKKMTPLPYVNH